MKSQPVFEKQFTTINFFHTMLVFKLSVLNKPTYLYKNIFETAWK
jgi:hypothetical protein